MTNKFDTQGNDYKAPEERNINSHGFQPVVQKNVEPFWRDFCLFYKNHDKTQTTD